ITYVGGTGHDVVITHKNTIPTVTAPSNQSSTEGASASFNLGSFTDPDPDSPWAVDINWGDSTSHTTFNLTSTGVITAQSHTFSEEGSYTVTVKVTDKNGASDSKTFTATVADAALTGSSSATSGGTEG